MAQRCILSSALRGFKFFPTTTTHYGLTLTGCDCNDSNRKKRQLSDIKKLCTGVFALSGANLSSVANIHCPKLRFEEFPSINRRIIAIIDGASALRHDVLTFSVSCVHDAAPSVNRNISVKKPCTADQYVQTDVMTANDAESQSPNLKSLLDELKGDLQNIYAIEQFNQGNIKRALLKWEIAASLGSVHALYNLGNYYCHHGESFCGNGNEFDKGAKFLKAAMDRGHQKAMYHLGALHVRRLLQPSDPAYGVQLIAKAANGGYPEALFYMGVRMLRSKNYEKAEAFLKNITHIETHRNDLRDLLRLCDIPDPARELLERLLA